MLNTFSVFYVILDLILSNALQLSNKGQHFLNSPSTFSSPFPQPSILYVVLMSVTVIKQLFYYSCILTSSFTF